MLLLLLFLFFFFLETRLRFIKTPLQRSYHEVGVRLQITTKKSKNKIYGNPYAIQVTLAATKEGGVSKQRQ
jgi:hypothetical protein